MEPVVELKASKFFRVFKAFKAFKVFRVFKAFKVFKALQEQLVDKDSRVFRGSKASKDL